MRDILNTIIAILLVLICIASHMLIEEIKSQTPINNYNIYETNENYKPKFVEREYYPILRVFETDKQEKYAYKFYKKMTLIGVCDCPRCKSKWSWKPAPKFKQPIEGVTVAANPKTLGAYKHIKSDDNEFIVHYIDESIPENVLYVYVKNHKDIEKLWCSGIHDIYKAKNDTKVWTKE